MGGSRALGGPGLARPAAGRWEPETQLGGFPGLTCLLTACCGLERGSQALPCRGSSLHLQRNSPALCSLPPPKKFPRNPRAYPGGSQVCPEPPSELSAQLLLSSCFLHKEGGESQQAGLAHPPRPGGRRCKALRKWVPAGEGLVPKPPRVRVTRPSPTRMLPQSW